VDRPSWATDDVDLDRPSIARIYDFFLGGSHNFAVDRAMAEQLLKVAPDMPDVMRANRSFLRRAVRFMMSSGITQFLDLGSGIPTVGNVHEVALAMNPQARVVYVDIDPVAVAHSRAMLQGREENTAIIKADLRDPEAILSAPETQRLLDMDRPIGLLIVSVLHFIQDEDDPQGATARLRDAMPPGSMLAITHAVRDARAEEQQVVQMYRRTGTEPVARTEAEIRELFGEFQPVEPGLVFLPLWRPDSPEDVEERPERFVAYAGVGQKP